MEEIEEYEDISRIRADSKSSQVTNKQLYDSIQDLSRLLNDMFSMFKNASEQMKLEEKLEEDRRKIHEEIMKKLDEIAEQNKTIATGMVDVSDIVKEKLGDSRQPMPPQQMPPPAWPKPGSMMPPMGPPMNPPMGPRPMAPMPQPMQGMMPPMQAPNDMPPLDFPELDEFPMEEPKKKKGFHLFGKKE